MIHVCTVHHRDDRWLRPQLEYLDRCLPLGGWKLYVSFDFTTRYDLTKNHPGIIVGLKQRILSYRPHHHRKLNKLAQAALSQAESGDSILFCDSDAFPVASIDHLVELLPRVKMVAVQRLEHKCEKPHNCFTLVDSDFWREIDGTWSIKHFDNFWCRAKKTGMPWIPLRRTAGTSLHPVFFSVYGGVAYHHGAGSRSPILWKTTRDMSVVERQCYMKRNKIISDLVFNNIVEGRGFWDGLDELNEKKLGDHEAVGVLASD